MLNVLRCQLTYQGQVVTNAETQFNKSLRPQKPEGSLGRTAQDVHLDSHSSWTMKPQRTSFNTLYNWGHKTPTQSKRRKDRKEKIKESWPRIHTIHSVTQGYLNMNKLKVFKSCFFPKNYSLLHKNISYTLLHHIRPILILQYVRFVDMRMIASHTYFDPGQVAQKLWTDLAVSVINRQLFSSWQLIWVKSLFFLAWTTHLKLTKLLLATINNYLSM